MTFVKHFYDLLNTLNQIEHILVADTTWLNFIRSISFKSDLGGI